MKKTLTKVVAGIAVGSLSASMAFAGGAPMADSHSNQQGWYMSGGVGAGWSSAESKPFTKVVGTSVGNVTTIGESNLIDGSGVTAKIDMGYQWQYFGVQVGYMYMPEFTEFESGSTFIGSAPGLFSIGGLSSKDVSSLNVLNFVGQFIMPVRSYFHLIVGGGLAIVFKNAHSRNSVETLDGAPTVVNTSQPGVEKTFYRPELVIGASRAISRHLSGKIVYTRIFGESNIGTNNAEANFLPDMNAMTLELSYFFHS